VQGRPALDDKMRRDGSIFTVEGDLAAPHMAGVTRCVSPTSASLPGTSNGQVVAHKIKTVGWYKFRQIDHGLYAAFAWPNVTRRSSCSTNGSQYRPFHLDFLACHQAQGVEARGKQITAFGSAFENGLGI
jgi:hypothetical protein